MTMPSDRPTPEQIWRDYRATYPARLREHGYVIVHPDDVLDWIERLSENPLGTPIYSTLTPGEAAADFMERFAAAEQEPTPPIITFGRDQVVGGSDQPTVEQETPLSYPMLWNGFKKIAAEQETPLQRASREVTEQQDQRQP